MKKRLIIIFAVLSLGAQTVPTHNQHTVDVLNGLARHFDEMGYTAQKTAALIPGAADQFTQKAQAYFDAADIIRSEIEQAGLISRVPPDVVPDPNPPKRYPYQYPSGRFP